MGKASIRIGGASGFWGDAARATPQLLAAENLDFIVYDYLAEITMSIMARARSKNPAAGFAGDFVSMAMKPNLKVIAEKGVKIISNAGGTNPVACAEALRAEIASQGLSLTVACVTGDDLLDRAESLASSGITEMFSGAGFPAAERMQSINAYLGAFPIAMALDQGADIVVAGRCVDSAVTLGACIHSFGWQREELDKLAQGSLAGHILECGPQATGGNFTDWEQVTGLANIGYPIAELQADGSFVTSKPDNTGGLVSIGTVAEQMLYEIGDPQAYILPDVVCDFSTVTLSQIGEHQVAVNGATGRPAPATYKVCGTYADQFRGGTTMTYYGIDAQKKAAAMGKAVFEATRNTFHAFGMPDFSETSIEMIGAESQYGAFAKVSNVREVGMKIAVKHPDAMGIGIFLKECVGLGLATPPGLSGFAGGRPKPSPVVRLFSFTLEKSLLPIRVEIDGKLIKCNDPAGIAFDVKSIVRPSIEPISTSDLVEVPLVKLAWARSGDKGNKANIGLIARKAEYLPYIWFSVTESVITERFAHFLDSAEPCAVERFLMPGSNAINFLLHNVLGGGGVASLRNDAQGKGYGQLALDCSVAIPANIAAQLAD